MEAPSRLWAECFRESHGDRIVGAMMFRYVLAPNVFDALSATERAMRFFWFATSHGEDLMLGCKIEAVFRFDVPQTGTHSAFNTNSQGLFNKLTSFSRDRLLQQFVGSDLAIQHVRQWKRDYNAGNPFGQMLDVAIHLPTVHIVLMAYSEWTTCIVPLPRSRRSMCAMGYRWVPDLVPPSFLEQGLPGDMPVSLDDFDTTTAHSVLRLTQCLQSVPPNLRCGIHDEGACSSIRGEIERLVHGLAYSHLHMVLDHARRSRLGCSMQISSYAV